MRQRRMPADRPDDRLELTTEHPVKFYPVQFETAQRWINPHIEWLERVSKAIATSKEHFEMAGLKEPLENNPHQSFLSIAEIRGWVTEPGCLFLVVADNMCLPYEERTIDRTTGVGELSSRGTLVGGDLISFEEFRLFTAPDDSNAAVFLELPDFAKGLSYPGLFTHQVNWQTCNALTTEVEKLNIGLLDVSVPLAFDYNVCFAYNDRRILRPD